MSINTLLKKKNIAKLVLSQELKRRSGVLSNCMGWSLLRIKDVIIAFLNPGLQLSDAQFAAWYDLQKFKRRM